MNAQRDRSSSFDIACQRHPSHQPYGRSNADRRLVAEESLRELFDIQRRELPLFILTGVKECPAGLHFVEALGQLPL